MDKVIKALPTLAFCFKNVYNFFVVMGLKVYFLSVTKDI